MRLIDADKLRDRIQNGYVCLIPDPDTDKIIRMIVDSIIKVIDEAPTVTSDKLEYAPKDGDKMISYINKQQAKDKLLELMGNVTAYGEYFEGIRNAYQSAADRLDTLPVIEERKHGRWKDGCCTVCGEPAATDTHRDFLDVSEQHYCYNCGAIMDGKEK